MKSRIAALFILSLIVIWFLYIERAILTPFVLAAIFAYIFNPLIDLISHKIRLPRGLSILIVYLLILTILIGSGVFLTRRVINESSDFATTVSSIVDNTKAQVQTLPDWIAPSLDEGLSDLESSKLFTPASLFSLFPAAISRVVSFVIFLFSAFYFLKEGRRMKDTMLNIVPKEYRIEIEILLRKINAVLGGYLRGQLSLVFIVATTLFIVLSILGVRYALILAVFSGFAEIVPFIGPITATSAAVLVVLFANTGFNFAINQFQVALIVVAIYFVVRQLEDYFVIPHIMGKVTNLHPLLIFFAVLAGGHLWGILGFLLAVPLAASIRIVFGFLLDKLASK